MFLTETDISQSTLTERRQAVGKKLYGSLFALEEALQLASQHAAEFAADLARAPAEAHLSRGYGQGTVARTAQVISFLAEARGSCAMAHAGLERAGKHLGVTMIWPFDDGYGTESTPPDKEPTGSKSDVIPLVAAAA